MQYRRDLIPRPLSMSHSPVGAQLPRVGTVSVPFKKDMRLRSFSRPAPENAAEAIHGLGAWDTTSMKARNIGGRLDSRMPFVGNRPILRPDIKLMAPPVFKVRNAPNFRNMNLQGLGDEMEPGAQYNTPTTGGGPVPGADNAGFWNTLNTALSSTQVNSLVNAGAKFYVQHETGNQAVSLANSQAQTLALQAQVAKNNAALAAGKSGSPSWLVPAMAIGGVALVATLFLASRKK